MSFGRDLRLYLGTLKYFGVLSASYKIEQNTFHSTPSDELLLTISLCTTQALAFSMLAYCIVYTDSFYLNGYNGTGNIYLSIHFALCCVVLSVISAYFYVIRCEHVRLVEQLLRYNCECLQNTSHNKYFARLYMSYLSFTLFCGITYSVAFMRSGISTWIFVSYVVMFTLIFMVCGIVLMFYACIKYVIAGTLRHYNQQLEQLLNVCGGHLCEKANSRQLMDILWKRYCLLVFCRNKVNRTYGIILIPIVVYIVFILPSGPFFMVSVVFEINLENYSAFIVSGLCSVMWDIPWLAVFIIIMASNGVDAEANKTVKILSKIPRCSSGIEKMIEKFLLKNLRQKPILTAYGFFSLDKSTLFQLFTTIFTYMLILVQFKEMESSKQPIDVAKV